MQFPRFHHPLTGLAVPVSALKSHDSIGIGEFADLIPLGRWAASVGLELIQILPVNDTAYERSPYSALSAFALHPVHARLQLFPEALEGRKAETIQSEIKALKAALPPGTGPENPGKIEFSGALEGKLHILRMMWESASSTSLKSAETWMKDNPWAKAYALFSLFRESHGLKSWQDWPDKQNPGKKDLEKLWKKHRKEAGFWIWLQWRLEEQFLAVAVALDGLGIALKGDIPILINDDSADVWAERENFRLSLRAGAPPDALAPGGQNWGFPTYNWENLRKDDFRWWRARLSQASKFYHAYRIDHVLGFFRIWAVPEGDISALNGRYDPSVTISRSDLETLGFDRARINWLSTAHFPGDELGNTYGPEADIVKEMLSRIGTEDLWCAENDSLSEKDVMASFLSDEVKNRLMESLRNRTLIPLDEENFLPFLNYQKTRGWNSLSNSEKDGLKLLISRTGAASEELWAENARELLEMMKTDGSMLVCAEDLGAVPSCVPGVLDELEILGLKVTRWARHWDVPGQPYEEFETYSPLSVSTSSVHDSSTLRSWLADEASEDGALRKALGISEDSVLSGSDGIRKVLEALQDGASLVCAYPLQDLLALESSCHTPNPGEERINIPGTVQDSNWTWRMGLFLEELPEKNKLNNEIQALSKRRNNRKATFPGA